MVMYVAMIIFFSFFYTAAVFNPQETADNLKKYGGFVPGSGSGSATAEYFDDVLTRLTAVGGLYLAAVCLLPELLISNYGLPFYFGGNVDFDRGVGDDGYGDADPVASACASV